MRENPLPETIDENARIECALVLRRQGAKLSSLSVVVNGQHLVCKLDDQTLMALLESGFAALRRR